MREREQVEGILREAIAQFLVAGAEQAAAQLADLAAVPVAESLKVFALLERIQERLKENDELTALVRALRGEYIEPGPGADLIQNPDILPTGRNTYAVNPYHNSFAIGFQSRGRRWLRLCSNAT